MGILRARVNGQWVDIPMYASSSLTIQDVWPAGSLRETIAAAADPGWLLMDGATVANSQTLYPALWAVAPTAWKSGSSLILPNLNGAILRGHSTDRGTLGGANAVSLALANLPAHSHTINHDHGSVNTGGESAEHTHGVNINSGYVSADHSHTVSGAINQFMGTAGSASSNIGSGGVGINTAPWTSGFSANHWHNVNGNTGGRSAGHTHAVDLPSFSGSSGNSGSGTPVSVQELGMNVGIQIKAH